MCWTHAGNVNVKQHYNPTKLPSFNMLSWLYCSCLTCLQLLFFFPFWTFPALRGCNLCADLRMCLLQSTLWVGDLTALCFTGAVIDWCHSRSPGRSGCGAQLATGDWKNPSQSPGRDIQQLQHERLEAVKSKWEDVFRAFCVFITRIYGRIPGCDTA